MKIRTVVVWDFLLILFGTVPVQQYPYSLTASDWDSLFMRTALQAAVWWPMGHTVDGWIVRLYNMFMTITGLISYYLSVPRSTALG